MSGNEQSTNFQPGFKPDRTLSDARKREIALNMLERYTGSPAELFQKQVLLTNFSYYIEQFRKITKCKKATVNRQP